MQLDFDTYCSFLETIPDAAVLVDDGGVMVHANQLACHLLGYAEGGLRGRRLSLIVPPAARAAHEASVEKYFSQPRLRPMGSVLNFSALRADDSLVAVDIMLRPLQIGQRPLALAVLRDITARQRLEEQLKAAIDRERRLALTDPLTGAANRRLFFETAQREIERTRRYGPVFSLCYLDLDEFKRVNDEHGHGVGDEVLRRVVQALRAPLRAADMLARLGGDEFALLLPQTDAAGAAAAVLKLRDSVARAMLAQGWPVTMSIGVLTCTEAPESVDALLTAADRLMYEAKSCGRDRWQAGRYHADQG